MPPGQYPYVRFTQFRDGSATRVDETPGNESQAQIHKLGSFEEVDNSGGHKHLKVGQSFDYSALGHTSTVDSNIHERVGGGKVSQVSGDSHVEHAGSMTLAVGNNVTHAIGGVHFTHATGGIHQSSSGDNVTDFNDGNHHHNVKGDAIKFIGGTKYENISGECGTYVPNGNFDVTSGGNVQFTCANFTVNSQGGITLNAGGNIIINSPYGQILINVNGITINASANVQINSTTNNIITQGIHTMIQGGGLPGSPTTFT